LARGATGGATASTMEIFLLVLKDFLNEAFDWDVYGGGPIELRDICVEKANAADGSKFLYHVKCFRLTFAIFSLDLYHLIFHFVEWVLMKQQGYSSSS
jgi:hypothetical protein